MVNLRRFSFKQCILIRVDLKMSVGKLVAQACHASLEAAEEARRLCPRVYEQWREEGGKKVVLRCSGEDDLIRYYNMAKKAGLPASLIRDAGLTEVPPGSITAVAIGPAREDEVDKITGQLKLL